MFNKTIVTRHITNSQIILYLFLIYYLISIIIVRYVQKYNNIRPCVESYCTHAIGTAVSIAEFDICIILIYHIINTYICRERERDSTVTH